MEGLLAQLADFAEVCEQARARFRTKETGSICDSLNLAIQKFRDARSRSWLGYHSSIYLDGFRPRQAGEHFHAEWGIEPGFSNRTWGGVARVHL